jgi:small-conductance mechanosensitive channel
MAPQPAPEPDLTALARSLRRDCALFVRSMAELRAIPREQVEEALAAHLRDTRALEQTLAASVEQLNARRGEVERLPAPARIEVTLCIAEARRMLQATAAACGDLAGDVADALCAVRRRLDSVQQGARMLRGYRRATR